MSKRLKIYILLGLCLMMASCDESCDNIFYSALDTNRTMLAGTSSGIYKLTPSPVLFGGSGGGQFTQILEIPALNPNLRPTLPAGLQPGLIGLSQWGITRWGLGSSAAMDTTMSSTPFNGVLDLSQPVIYTSHPSEGEIQKFNLISNSVVKFIQLGSTIQPTLMTSPFDCDFIGFLDAKNLKVMLLDPRSDLVTSTISPGGSPSGLRFTPDGRQLWVLDTMNSSISTWEPRTSTQIGKITMIPSPSSVLFTRNGSDAYVTSNASPFRLYFVSTETYQIDNMLTLDEKPVGIAQDLFGSNVWIQNVSGSITAIDPIRYSVIGKTPAAPGTPLSLFSMSLRLQF